jgi:hypothetical protein
VSDQDTVVPEPEAFSSGSGSGSPLDAITEHPFVQEHPEALVGGAFAGAFILAKLLKAIGN